VLSDPYGHYREIRDLGPVVWLPRNGIRVAARYRDAREILRTPDVFSSSHGVALSGPFFSDDEEFETPITLTSVGETHARLRSVLSRPMTPPRLGELVDTVHDMAEQRVLHLLQQDSFDGVQDFAQFLPVELAGHLVGQPAAGREHMLEWSDGIFNVLGGLNKRALDAFEIATQMVGYAFSVERTTLRPGS
jgi:cytochrome P450